MRQHTNTSESSSAKICTILRLLKMLREMQREVNMGRPFESRLHINYYTNNHFSQLSSASDLDLLLHDYSLMEKTTRTQNHEEILEQLA